MTRVWVALAAAVMLLGAGAPEAPVVTLSEGALRGALSDGIATFRGIPYAAPPVGALRWQPPAKPAAWTGVRDASAFGSPCPQPDAGAFFAPGTTEDCLFINVTAPAAAVGSKTRRAVMVWIPGGGLYGGSSSDYDLSALAASDTVVVSFNYRVGILGFFAHPALDAERHDLGDYGIMDQQQALRWVHDNIAAFGGDPQKVTIFGQSAGGISVLAHIASPNSAALFQRAIVESGGTPALTRTLTPLDRAEANGRRFAAAAGCADPQIMACLRALTPANILAATPGTLSGLIGGTATLPKTFKATFTGGTFNRVPLLIGNTRDEWRWPIAQAEITSGVPLAAEKYGASLAAFFGAAAAPAILTEYQVANYPTPSQALGAAETDGYMACSSLTLDRWLAPFISVYAYQFDDTNAPMYMKPVSFPYGAAHTIELQFLFPGYRGDRGVMHPLTPAEQSLAHDMVAYWTNFAKTGDPNASGLTPWPRYAPAGEPILSLTTPRIRQLDVFVFQHHCNFWDTIAL